MSNLSYWERRQAQRMFEYMQAAEDTADEISKVYYKASGYVSHEMDQIFGKFRNKHALSDAEAYRLLNTMQDKASLNELRQALRAAGPNSETRAAILADLEGPAYQARLERLQQTQNQLDLTMRDVYKQEKIRNSSHYVDLGNEAYYRTIFDIQQRTGFGFSFAAIDHKVIDRVINSKWYGANYSGRIWRNTQGLAKSIKEELLVSLITGRTDREVADIIANKFASGASAARRLVRTESCNLANQMEMISYEECGIEYYRFVATLDLRTSDVCRSLDGKRFKVSEQQPGLNCPPMHPWCRSTTICDIANNELAAMQRRARNPETGKTEMVPADMTYQQWHVKYVENNPAWTNTTQSGKIKENAFKTEVIDRLPKIENVVSNNARKNFAIELINRLGIDDSDIEISVEQTSQRGYCQFRTNGEICNYFRYVLQENDDRTTPYKIKTAFHEAFHLSLKGRKWDAVKAGKINEKWRVIEESMTEASAHYALELYGVKEKLSPAYGSLLVQTLPRLKKLKKYKNCTDLVDFGRIAWRERLLGNSGKWSDLYDEAFSVKFNEATYYKKYFKYIDVHRDELFQKVFENSPGLSIYRNELEIDLKNSMQKIKEGKTIAELSSNQQFVFSDILVNAMMQEGIK